MPFLRSARNHKKIKNQCVTLQVRNPLWKLKIMAGKRVSFSISRSWAGSMTVEAGAGADHVSVFHGAHGGPHEHHGTPAASFRPGLEAEGEKNRPVRLPHRGRVFSPDTLEPGEMELVSGLSQGAVRLMVERLHGGGGGHGPGRGFLRLGQPDSGGRGDHRFDCELHHPPALPHFSPWIGCPSRSAASGERGRGRRGETAGKAARRMRRMRSYIWGRMEAGIIGAAPATISTTICRRWRFLRSAACAASRGSAIAPARCAAEEAAAQCM